MVQNWLLLGCHLLLGVWILYRSLDVEQSFTTARNVAITTIVTIFSVVNFWIWICPMNRIRNIQDVGYRHVGGTGKQKAAAVNRARRLKQIGRTPPPFPNGWFVLLESRDLVRGQVLAVDALGLNLAVYRGSDSGSVFVTDAYCPHLGANIAVGGRVRGDCIQCPFHNWKFCGDSGRCVQVPYSHGSIPAQARLVTRPCVETNGLVMVWHHVDGDQPSWYPPAISQVESGQWVYQGRNEFYVNCHIQDIPENGADVAHLDAVHSASIMLGGEPNQKQEDATEAISKHHWEAKWTVGEEPHTARIKLHHKKVFLGKWTVFSLGVDALQIGPALVHLNFQSMLGDGVMIQYVLPVEENVQKLVHIFYTSRSWIPPYAKVVLLGESILVERDIRVWNNKTYVEKPAYVKEDKLLKEHRKWYSKFYSEGSRSARSNNGSLDW